MSAPGSGRFAGNEVWEHVAATRPSYVRAAERLDEVAGSGPLDPKTRAFVRLALNAAVTHLNARGIAAAIDEALAAGATRDELFEVLMVACTLGVHGMNAEVLAEVLDARGERGETRFDDEQERIREEYRRTRGYWRDFLDPTLEYAPRFLEAYLDFSGAPWREGVLEPKVREFIYLAFDTSPTHLHLVGLRVHIDNALEHGASVGEIVEVMSLAAAMGLQTLDVAVPLLDEALGRKAIS